MLHFRPQFETASLRRSPADLSPFGNSPIHDNGAKRGYLRRRNEKPRAA
jgi:hypothetical protein